MDIFLAGLAQMIGSSANPINYDMAGLPFRSLEATVFFSDRAPTMALAKIRTSSGMIMTER